MNIKKVLFAKNKNPEKENTRQLAIINFIVGWQWVLKDYYDGLMVAKSATTGKMEDLHIYESDILAFGVTNMIDAILAFLIFSYIIKWWSSNCSRAPF